MSVDLASLALVILAGGDSVRMGRPKALLDVDGTPFVAWQLARFRAAGGGPAVVVLGRDAHACLAAAGDLPHVINKDPGRGPFSSLTIGLRALAARAPLGYFVLPVDVPASGAEVWLQLALGLRDGVEVVRPRHGGRGGHPVLLGRAFARRLMAIDLASRLDAEIRTLASGQVVDVAVEDPSVGCNLNDPEAFEAWGLERQRGIASHRNHTL